MKLKEIRKRLISYGYHPDEVEYAIIEVLQYKKPESLNKMDLKILSNMLEERMQITRAETKKYSLLMK